MFHRFMLRLRGPERPHCQDCVEGAHLHGWRGFICPKCSDDVLLAWCDMTHERGLSCDPYFCQRKEAKQ